MKAKVYDKAFHSIRIKITDEIGRDISITMKHSGLSMKSSIGIGQELFQELFKKVNKFLTGGQVYGEAFKSLANMADMSGSFIDLNSRLS